MCSDDVKPESRMYCPACTVDVDHVVVAANVLIHGLDASFTYVDMVYGIGCGITAWPLSSLVLSHFDLCID